jgi:periplasmic protein TonB
LEDTMVNETAFDRTLFADTLAPSWTERARRGWTTLTSFGLQALVVGILLLLPMLRPTGLPSFHQLSTPISLGQPLVEAPAARAQASSNSASSRAEDFIFRRPSRLPIDTHPASDDGPPGVSHTAALGLNVPGAVGGDPNGLRGLFENGARPILPTAPPLTAVHPLRLSRMSEGDLIRKVQPAYPALARSARVQGIVVLQAMISKQGTIENLRILTGHPMLAPAAVEAVRQWRYRPYILNGEPVEVETQITVNFALGGN